MRNCEQLWGSLGLFAYCVGTLDLLNDALSDYGPENCRGYPRVTIKERKGQTTAIERQNIKVASFSGTVVSFRLLHIESVSLSTSKYNVHVILKEMIIIMIFNFFNLIKKKNELPILTFLSC